MGAKILFGLQILLVSSPLHADLFLSKCRKGLGEVPRIEDVLFAHPAHVTTHPSDNLSILSTQGSRTADHEVAALKKLAQHVPEKNFLLAAEMEGFRAGIPIFDGVIYDANGNAETNFSLKSVMLDELSGDNLNNSFRSANNYAKSKLKGFYSGNWMSRRGFSYSNGVYTAEKGNKFDHRTSEPVNHFAELFGIKEGNYRPSSIVVDFYSSKKEKAESVNFQISDETDEGGQPVKILLLSADGHTPRRISLSSLQRSLQGLDHLKSYFLVSGNQVIEISPEAIRLHSQPKP